MPTPCIVALQRDSLIRHTVANLINSSNDRLTAIESEAENLEELIQEINQYEAKVILFENSRPFAQVSSLLKLLLIQPQVLVIIIEEDNNWLHIFRKENVLLNSTSELLEVIQSA